MQREGQKFLLVGLEHRSRSYKESLRKRTKCIIAAIDTLIVDDRISQATV